MQGALDDAGLRASDVAYLNLHGTGTPLNDSMEAAAVDAVFPAGLPCSSSKSLVGHTLGAAGAMEAAFCWLALAHAEDGSLSVPPHCWDGAADPAGGEEGSGRRFRARCAARPLTMTNSFGFGGNNCTLVLGAPA